jgi:hypothetical protein
MVSKLSARGMPTDNLEGALAWRRRHLDPGRTKEDGPRGVPMSVITANRMGELASKDFATWLDDFQAALRAVPTYHRAKVQLPVTVMNRIIKPVITVLDDGDPEAEAAATSGSMDDDEADLMGQFWYSIAANEFVLHEGRLIAAERPAIELMPAFSDAGGRSGPVVGQQTNSPES